MKLKKRKQRGEIFLPPQGITIGVQRGRSVHAEFLKKELFVLGADLLEAGAAIVVEFVRRPGHQHWNCGAFPPGRRRSK